MLCPLEVLPLPYNTIVNFCFSLLPLALSLSLSAYHQSLLASYIGSHIAQFIVMPNAVGVRPLYSPVCFNSIGCCVRCDEWLVRVL